MENIRLIIRVENYEKYKECVQKGPYIRQMDLVIFCSQLLYQSDKEMQTRHVTWDMLRRWDMSPEAMFKKAGEDSRRYLPPYLERMETMMLEHMTCELMEREHKSKKQAREQAEKEYTQMFGNDTKNAKTIYVVSNQNLIYGASVIFYDDVLKALAKEKGEDLILLPSSIHEWLVMKEGDVDSLKDLQSVVRDANRFVVSEAEVLSDGVYRYSLKNNCIEKVELDDEYEG